MNEHLMYISCASRTVLASHGGAGLVVHSSHSPHLLTHHIHEYQVDILWISMLPCSFHGAKGGGDGGSGSSSGGSSSGVSGGSTDNRFAK
jgi:hypothetical protein